MKKLKNFRYISYKVFALGVCVLLFLLVLTVYQIVLLLQGEATLGAILLLVIVSNLFAGIFWWQIVIP